MAEFYIVGGVIGAGKTSIMTKAKELGARFEVINVGDKFIEIVKKHKLKITRDELRLFKDIELYKKLHYEVIDSIARMKKSKNKIVLDTRFALHMKVGYYPGIPPYILQKLRPKKIILIEARPIEVLRRWVRDAARKRGYEFELDIEEYATMERMYAVAFSEMGHIPLKIIENREDELEKAAKEFIEAIK